MTKIMLIDDDESLQTLIGQIITRQGWDFCCASNGEEGLTMLRKERPDLLILDVMLPDMNGFDICRTIRAEGRRVLVMFLSAKGDIVDKSVGFNMGGDDYLVKPFQPEELVLRISAHLRRRKLTPAGEQPEGCESYKVGGLEIFFDKYEVRLKGEIVPMSSREFEILALLAKNPGAVFTRAQILEALWEDEDAADPNTITVLVRKIREKIEEVPSKPQYLMTVWRVGYKLADRL